MERRSVRRSIALLIAGVMVGGILLTPAGAHVGGTVAHLWGHLLDHAKKSFYTKTQSNARYLLKSGKAADANELDGHDSTYFGRTTHDRLIAALDLPDTGGQLIPVLDQDLEPGTYLIQAKTVGVPDSGDFVRCVITVGGVELDRSAAGAIAPLPLMAVHSSADAFTAELLCSHDSGSATSYIEDSVLIVEQIGSSA